MTTKRRVDAYIELGFSAERISELFDWPLPEVRHRKLTKPWPHIEAAVMMVLGGKSFDKAARDTGCSLADVRFGVMKARGEIDDLAKASG